MSSFIVHPKTVNCVVSFLYWKTQKQDWTPKRLSNELNLDVHDSPGSLAQAMTALNYRATNERYQENEDFKQDESRFDFVIGDRIQVLKSLRCWLYQCNEGDVPETALYKIMDEYADILAYHIVCDLPEYEKAMWDWSQQLA
jgi:hypothetical protein